MRDSLEAVGDVTRASAASRGRASSFDFYRQSAWELRTLEEARGRSATSENRREHGSRASHHAGGVGADGADGDPRAVRARGAARHDGSRPSGAELGDVATRGASTRGDVDALDAATCAARVDAATDPPPREANQSPPPPPSATAPRVATEFLDDRYIVRFRDYRMVGVHRASLERVLGPPRNAADLDANLYAHDDPPADPAPAVPPARWEWVERRNKAASTPPISPSSVSERRRRDGARRHRAIQPPARRSP